MSTVEIHQMPFKKIILTFLLASFASSPAISSETPKICTTKIRHYCATQTACRANHDPEPSLYEIRFTSAKAVEVKKIIGDKQTSSWQASTHDQSDGRVFFETGGIHSVLSLSSDNHSFVLTHHSVNSSDPTAMIEIGTCSEK